ncbi:pilus assembly protein TadG-related protein [Roseibium sp.]|uniref:TadE/TadG family type IV pilus assembly protein n=1 Tax=Roseibium sp. TaxID=1936156 RepID=UPI003D136A3F
MSLLRLLSKDRQGSVLPLFGLLVILLVVIGGAAIDVSRAINAREKLSYAIDAAALSVATELSIREMSDSQVRTHLENSFKANLKQSEWRQAAIDNISFDINTDNGTISMSSWSSLPNYFVDLGGYGQKAFGPEVFQFGNSAQTTYSRFNVEIAVALDVTNSISSVPGGLQSVKSAAQDLIDILISDQATPSTAKAKIALIPYSWGVNAGSYTSQLAEGRIDGSRCITDRETLSRYKEGPYWNNFGNTGFNQGAERFYYISYDRWYGAQTNCPYTPVQPLTADKSDLDGTIRNLSLIGGTGGQAGVAWSWYTLSPEWASIWPRESQPLPYDNSSRPKNRKIAILMTDGEFNTWWDWERTERRRCWYSSSENKIVCSGQDKWEWTQRGYYTLPSYQEPSVQRSLELCRLMKGKGIQIYSVFFETGMGKTPFGTRMLQECSSGGDFYYEAGNREELKQAFQNIAKKIQQIYLSQ